MQKLNNETVSVIIPVYNTQKFIYKSINSIINQSYKDLEIIIVNNESTDNSLKICTQFAKKDGRIKIINTKHGTAAHARNEGIKAASGKYMIFVDSDDWMSKDGIKSLIERMKLCNADYCHGSYVRVQSNGNKVCSTPVIDCTKENADEFCKLVNSTMFAPWMILYKTDIIHENKILFMEDVLLAEDVIFVETYLRYCNKFATVSNTVYFYNQIYSGSVSQKYYRDLYIWCYLATDALFKIYSNEFTLCPIVVKCFNGRVLGWFYKNFFEAANNNDINEFQKIAKKVISYYIDYQPWNMEIVGSKDNPWVCQILSFKNCICNCIDNNDFFELFNFFKKKNSFTLKDYVKSVLKKCSARIKFFYYFILLRSNY